MNEELRSQTETIILSKFNLICPSRLTFSKYKPRKALEEDICVGIKQQIIRILHINYIIIELE